MATEAKARGRGHMLRTLEPQKLQEAGRTPWEPRECGPDAWRAHAGLQTERVGVCCVKRHLPPGLCHLLRPPQDTDTVMQALWNCSLGSISFTPRLCR